MESHFSFTPLTPESSLQSEAARPSGANAKLDLLVIIETRKIITQAFTTRHFFQGETGMEQL
jgi:hypothetical protein